MRSKNKQFNKVLLSFSLLATGALLISSCETTRDQETQARLFNAQRRLMELEKRLIKKTHDSSKRESAISLNVAETKIRQNEYETDLQTLKGELETFRHFLGINNLRAEELDQKRLDNRLVSMEKNSEQLKKVETRIAGIEKRQKEILKHLEKIAKTRLDSATAKAAPSRKSSKSKTTINSVSRANQAFRKKQYTKLVQVLPSLAKKYKGKNKNTLNFLYAESLYNLGRVNEAALAFDGLFKTEKYGPRLRKVYLRMGDCFRRMGDGKTATIYYEELIEKYPKAHESMAAGSHLSKLKKKKG